MADNSNKSKLLGYKAMLYGAALFVLSIMQTSFFSQINILGATPDLLLGAVLTLAMFEDHKTSAVCGIIAGFFYCALVYVRIRFLERFGASFWKKLRFLYLACAPHLRCKGALQLG